MALHPTRRQAVWLHLSLVLAVVVLATGCATTSARLPTPTVIPTATPTPHPAPTPVSGLLAPPPTDCQAVPEPQHMTLPADFGGGFIGGPEVLGAPPVWQLGLGDAGPIDLESISGPTPYPGTKVLWIVGPNYGELVTLQGHDLRTGTPIWFSLLDRSGTTANAALLVALDPAIPNRGATDNSAGHWSIYGVGLTFTVAGCYGLDVSWPEGHWRTVFAAGR